MKKLMIIALALSAVLAFASCGNETKDSKSGTTAPGASDKIQTTAKSQSAEDSLSAKILDPFINENEVYFDIHVSADVVKDFSITVGSETITSSKKVVVKEGDTIKVNGNGQEDKDLYVYRIYRKSENNQIKITNFIGKGVDPERLENMLQTSYSMVKPGERAYFAILDTPKGWDRTLSDPLNDYLDNLTK